MFDQARPVVGSRKQKIEQMMRGIAVRGNLREPDSIRRRPIRQVNGAEFPHIAALAADLLPGFQLRIENGGEYFRRQIARPDVDPAVLVYFTAEEPLPVRSSLPQYLGPIDKFRVVDQTS